jgi:hypothetical protein
MTLGRIIRRLVRISRTTGLSLSPEPWTVFVPPLAVSCHQTVGETQLHLETIQNEGGYPTNLIARMLYGCGLRVTEPVNLRIKDLNLERHSLWAWLFPAHYTCRKLSDATGFSCVSAA